MSKIVRINNGDYKLSVRDSDGNLTLTTFEQNALSISKINLFSKDIVMNGISGQSTIVSTANSSVNLFNDTATTVNAFGDATIIDIGASTGTLTIKNANTVLDGDLEVKGGDITTNQSTFNLLNTVADTINAFGTATTISIGPSITHTVDAIQRNGPILQLVKSGSDATITIQGNLVVYGSTTNINSSTLQVDDINIEMGVLGTPSNITANGGGIILKGSTDKTIIWDNTNANWTSSENWNVAAGNIYKINNVTVVTPTTLLPTATTIEIGTAGGSTTIHNDSLILDGDLLVKGGDITTNKTTFNLLNNTATTVNALGAATSIDIGASTGTLTINNPTTILGGDLNINGAYNTYSSTGAVQSKINLKIISSTNGSLIIPSGDSISRDAIPQVGYTRFNTDISKLETYDGSSWVIVGDGNAKITGVTGSFITPTGTSSQRDLSPSTGYLRYNTDLGLLEVYDGSSWHNVNEGAGNAIITSETGSFVTPTGTSAQRDALPSTGFLRYNTELGMFEGYDGTQWQPLNLSSIDGGLFGDPLASTSVDGGTY